MGASFTSSSSKHRASLPAFPQPREGSDYPRVHEEQQAERELQRYYDGTLQALASEPNPTLNPNLTLT